MKKTRNQVI